jgi:amidase
VKADLRKPLLLAKRNKKVLKECVPSLFPKDGKHMVVIDSKAFSYFFDRKNKPVADASVGDKILFRTVDCFCDQIKKEEDLLPPGGSIPTAGPLFVNGTAPGNILVIKILDIMCENHGVLRMGPNEGVLRQYVRTPYNKIVKIENGNTFFSHDLVIKNRPHVGTIGTTPIGRIPTHLNGSHGGNIDCPEAGIGATLYFPVFVEGALLQAGDVHANMGECEISVGIECGAEIIIEIIGVIDNKCIPAPIIEHKDYWYMLSNAPSLEQAVRIGAKRMVDFLCYKLEISIEEATLLTSTVANIRIAQASEGTADVTVFVQFPKYIDKKNRLSAF